MPTRPRQLTGRGPMSTGDALQWAVAEQFRQGRPRFLHHLPHRARRCGPDGADRTAILLRLPRYDGHTADRHQTGQRRRFRHHAIRNCRRLCSPLAGQTKPARMSLSGKPKEYSGLMFPHDLHMARRGGVAKMASRLGAKEGYGSSLVCADCHTPTADEVGFLPVNMEEDCESCHSLVYDKVGDHVPDVAARRCRPDARRSGRAGPRTAQRREFRHAARTPAPRPIFARRPLLPEFRPRRSARWSRSTVRWPRTECAANATSPPPSTASRM